MGGRHLRCCLGGTRIRVVRVGFGETHSVNHTLSRMQPRTVFRYGKEMGREVGGRVEWRRKQESDGEGGEEEEVGVRWRDSRFLLDGRNNSSRRSKRATQ